MKKDSTMVWFLCEWRKEICMAKNYYIDFSILNLLWRYILRYFIKLFYVSSFFSAICSSELYSIQLTTINSLAHSKSLGKSMILQKETRPNPNRVSAKVSMKILQISLQQTRRFIWVFTQPRSSRLQMFFKGVLKNFANFTGKHLRRSLVLIKLQA